MKDRTYYILTTILILISLLRVNGQENKLFCENEYLLFSGFNKTIETDFSFFKIRTDTKAKLETLVDSIHCHYFEFLLNFEFDSETTIPIRNYISYIIDCEGPPPPPFTPRHDIHLFLIGTDTLFIQSDRVEIEKLEEIILDFYQSKTEEVFARTFISLYWDNTINETVFQNTLVQCLKAYSRFVDNQSNLLYGQSICKLNQGKLRDLYKKFPFNIKTDFYNDNLYYMRVPPPPVPVDEENNYINYDK
ncbi:MAG: hypothetical protein ACK4VN_10075 [Bacteroidales bacterium]